MALRRGFFGWLIPAAFVLPAWLIVGWIVTGASPWALLWVFVSAPIVFAWELILTLLVRARGTVRADRAVSWTDVGLFGLWHVLIFALGFFNGTWWWPTFALTVAVGLALLWVQLWQLWREARPARVVLRTPGGVGYIPPADPVEPESSTPGVFVITEDNTRPQS